MESYNKCGQYCGGYLCVSVTVLLLLVRTGSVTPAGAVTVAVLGSGLRADVLTVTRREERWSYVNGFSSLP